MYNYLLARSPTVRLIRMMDIRSASRNASGELRMDLRPVSHLALHRSMAH